MVALVPGGKFPGPAVRAWRSLRQLAFVAGYVAVISIAGGAFAWLRLRSGSIAAPLLAHAALNDTALVARPFAHALDGTAAAGG